MLIHEAVSFMIEPSAYTLNIGFGVPPLLQVSRRVIHMEFIKALIIWIALSRASSVIWRVPSWMNFCVSSPFHISRTAFLTRLGSLVRRFLMVNRNDGHFMGGVVIRKVMGWEAQTVCCSRIWWCTLLRPCMRKVVGIRLRAFPSSLGRGDATAMSVDWVISTNAEKMLSLIFSWRLGLRASLSKGIARSFSPVNSRHSSRVFGSMYW